MTGNGATTIGNQTETEGIQLIPVAEMVELTGVSERTLRDYRNGIEKTLQRRITKRIPHGKTFKICFLPEAVQMIEDWRNRYSDEDFLGKYASNDNEAIEAEDITAFEIPSVEPGLIVHQEAVIDGEFVESLAALIPRPTVDLTISDHTQKSVMLGKTLALIESQEIENRANHNKARVDRAYSDAYESEIEVMTAEIAARKNARELAEDVKALEILQKRIQAAKGGDAKTANKSRKR